MKLVLFYLTIQTSDFQVNQGDRIAQLILEKIETPVVQEVTRFG